MKLYRFMPYTSDMSRDTINLSLGRFNEAMNLLNNGVISPSVDLLYGPAWWRDNKANSFQNKMLTKFFSPSLADIILFLSDYEEQYFSAVILEIDVPLEKVQEFLGLGYYTLGSRIEFCIPYLNLYELINGEFNSALIKIDEFLKQKGNWSIFQKIKEELTLYGYLKTYGEECLGLTTYCNNYLYRYLCFPINKSYAFFITSDIFNLKMIALDTIARRSRAYQEQIAQDKQIDVGTFLNVAKNPLEEENETLKRVLKKENQQFNFVKP